MATEPVLSRSKVGPDEGGTRFKIGLAYEKNGKDPNLNASSKVTVAFAIRATEQRKAELPGDAEERLATDYKIDVSTLGPLAIAANTDESCKNDASNS